MRVEQLTSVLLTLFWAPILMAGNAIPGYERLDNTGGDLTGDGPRVYRSDPATYLVLDEGTEVEWVNEGENIVLGLTSGLMLIQTRRTDPSARGVQYGLGERRYRVTNGTVVLMVDEEAPTVAVVLSGDQFALGERGLLLDQTSAPLVSLEAGGVVVVHHGIRDLIREDQLRVYRAVVRAIELLADLLVTEAEGVRSADLGASLETARVLRLRIPDQSRRTLHAVLVAAAGREAFEKRHRPFQLPALLEIPEEIEPWDDVLGW